MLRFAGKADVCDFLFIDSLEYVRNRVLCVGEAIGCDLLVFEFDKDSLGV